MKVYMETLGCPKNFNDTETAKGIMDRAGISLVRLPEDADIMILNTCGFINDAKRESIARILELAEYRCGGRKLVVSGCLSQRYGKELAAEMPEADRFIGVNDYERLPEILKELEASCGGKPCTEMTPCTETFLKPLPRLLAEEPYSATLKIAEGCNNRCAYCSIPDIRGPFRSKRKEDVIREAEVLAAAGCKELILIAQDVTFYGFDLYGKPVLPELLRELCRIDGIRWIRLMYCYEDRVTDELLRVMAEEEKICKYIDLPLQHISDRVLKAMRRRSTEKSIRAAIERLRQAVPGVHIRTTFITGFPGETEEDFEKLMDFVAETRFDRLGVFAYSQEENTPAGDMEDQIPEEVRRQRADALMRLQMDISLENNRKKIGKTLEVLVEERDEDGSYIGRTAYDAPEIDDSVIFTSDREGIKPGTFVNVTIEDAFDYDLTGREAER